MKVDPDVDERPEVSPEERASNALLHRIRKMRWIGTKSEAERLEMMLAELSQRKTCWPVAGTLVSRRRTASPQLHLSLVQNMDAGDSN